MTPLHWYRIARTASPLRIGLVAIVVAMAAGWTHTSQSLAASNLTVDVRAPTPGTPATSGPVVIDVHTTVAADTPGALPPQLRVLGVRMPAGYTLAVDAIPPCADPDALPTRGSAACGAASKLGTGKASVQVSGILPVTATTQELSIFRSTENKILAYAKITEPREIAVVLPGILHLRPPDAPLLRLDLTKILRPAGMRAAVTSADLTLTRGVQAGPCPWTFKAQLEFVDAPANVMFPSAPCAQPPAVAPAPAPAPLVLHASARKRNTRASGARFAIRLSAPATVTVTLERRAAKRWITVRSLSVSRRAGSTSLTVRTVRGRPLPAGRYRARLQAVDDATGAASAPRTVRFTVRRGGTRR